MITGIVISGKEEDVIETCLKSLDWVDELLVILWNSNSETEDLARKYTKNILNYSGDSFSEIRNLGMEKAMGEWVLYVDADERVLTPLKEEIIDISKSSNKGAFALSRKNIIFGKPVNYGPYQHDWMIRLFKKDKFKTWVGKVHEHGEFEGDLGYSKNSLLHLTHRNIDHFLLKSLAWSKVDAKLRYDAGHPKMSSWRFMRILFTEMIHQGIQRRGFFSGAVGMIDSMLQVFFFYMTYVRLWEMQQDKPLDQAYQEIDKKLVQNNFNY